MNTCSKTVGGKTCNGVTIKYGRFGRQQRYRCKDCKHTFLESYTNNACNANTCKSIATLLKEGCGIRSIARLLLISPSTVLNRIQNIACSLTVPAIIPGRTYEVDELRTYIKNRSNECWIIYALDKHNGTVSYIKVGRRTKET